MCPSRFCNQLIVFTLLGIGLLVWACKTTQSKENSIDEARELAIDKLGIEIESFPNSTGDFTLFIQKASSSNTTSTLKLVVIQVANGKIVVEQRFTPGHAKWITDSTLEVLSVPGVIRESENLSDYTTHIDVRATKD